MKDLHVHVGPWKFDVNHTTLPQIRKEMKNAGVEKFAVMVSAPDDHHTHVANINLLNESEGLNFIYWLDPRDTRLSELDSIGNRLMAVKLHPSYTRTRPDSLKMQKFLDWCERNRKPLMVHCGRWNKYADYRFTVNVLRERKLTAILAHMGGPAYDLKANALDFISAQALKGRLMVDTSTCFQPYLIEKAVKTLGAENVIMGSDYPLHHPTPTMQTVQMARIAGGSVRRILDLNYEEMTP